MKSEIAFIERLFDSRPVSAAQRIKQNGKGSTVTKLRFTSISETEAMSEEKRESEKRSASRRSEAVSLSVTRCHHVEFNGLSKTTFKLPSSS